MSRNTRAKQSIKHILLNSPVALSHAEMQEQLKGLCDRVTIYRVLKRLEDEGLIHRVHNVDGAVKYARCSHPPTVPHHEHHDHVHFNCNKCHEVTCLDEVSPLYSIPADYAVEDVNFVLSGVCPNCHG